MMNQARLLSDILLQTTRAPKSELTKLTIEIKQNETENIAHEEVIHPKINRIHPLAESKFRDLP